MISHRVELHGFLKSRAADDIADDILQDMWLRISGLPREAQDAVRSPLSYLYWSINMLLIDRRRQNLQAGLRHYRWLEAFGASLEQPPADRIVEARQTVALVEDVLRRQGARARRVFRRHRIDGVSQREVAIEMGVSIGTVEGDLRRIYAALAAFRRDVNEVCAAPVGRAVRYGDAAGDRAERIHEKEVKATDLF